MKNYDGNKDPLDHLESFKTLMHLQEVPDKILLAAFTNGLRKGKFLFSLYKNDSKTMSDVLYRATKYMNAEDALLTREKRERQEDTQQDRGRKMARTGDAGRTEATPPVEHQAPTKVLPVKRMA